MKQRPKLSLALITLMLSLVLVACGGSATNTPAPAAATTAAGAVASTATKAPAATAIPTNVAAPALGATPTVATTTNLERVILVQGVDPSTLDPGDHQETPATNILNNIYETLVARDAQLQYIPRLAESWKQVDDLTWEFKLRKGVKWHDGSEFTADDVKFTIERYLDANRKPKVLVAASTLSFVASATAVDPLTIQIKTKNPYPIMVNQMTALQISSKKYYTDKGGPAKGDSIAGSGEETMATTPMGTGPYKFKEGSKAKGYYDLDINKDYWGAAPKVQAVRFRTIPDANTRLAALQAGEVDLITNVPPELISDLEKKGIGISSVPSVRVAFIVLNTTEANSPLANPKVRQALNYAIDRQAIIDKILRGNGIRTNSMLTDQHFGYNKELEPYKYDPAKAKQLLTEAGYPNGIDITFNHPTGRYLKDKEAAEVVIANWNDVGIRTKVESPEWTQYVNLINTRKQAQAWMIAWGNATWDADQTIWSQIRKGGTYTYIDNPTAWTKLDEAQGTTDSAKRLDLYKDVTKYMYDDATHVFLWQFKDIYGYNKSKIVFNARPDERLNAFEISSVK